MAVANIARVHYDILHIVISELRFCTFALKDISGRVRLLLCLVIVQNSHLYSIRSSSKCDSRDILRLPYNDKWAKM